MILQLEHSPSCSASAISAAVKDWKNVPGVARVAVAAVEKRAGTKDRFARPIPVLLGTGMPSNSAAVSRQLSSMAEQCHRIECDSVIDLPRWYWLERIPITV